MPINRSKFSKIVDEDLSKARSVGPSFSKKIRKTGLQIMRQKFEGYTAKQISNLPHGHQNITIYSVKI